MMTIEETTVELTSEQILAQVQAELKRVQNENARVQNENARLRNRSTKNDIPAIVEYIIDQRGTKSRRLIAKDMDAQGLCKESSAFHYLSMLNIMDEFHSQMSVIDD